MLDFITSILEKIRKNLLGSYLAGGDCTDKGNDWRVLVYHINGDDVEHWDMFEGYLRHLLAKEVDQLTDSQQSELTAKAVDELGHEYIGERIQPHPHEVVMRYLFNLLWKRADEDSAIIEEKDEDDTEEDEEEERDVETLLSELYELIQEGSTHGNDEVKTFAQRVSLLVEQLALRLD